jgi:hypothetical protein
MLDTAMARSLELEADRETVARWTRVHDSHKHYRRRA